MRKTKDMIAAKRRLLLISWSSATFVKLADADQAMVFTVVERCGCGSLSSQSSYIITVYPTWRGYVLGDGGHEYMKPVMTTLR